MRQELVLFYRKKHYFSMEQVKYGELGLMILDESLYFGGMFEKSIVQRRKYGTTPIRESFGVLKSEIILPKRKSTEKGGE